MKTAIEISSLIMGQFVDSQEAENLIKEYAKQVAEQALKDAYENSELEYIPSKYPYCADTATINKESIINTEIKTP